MAVMAWAAAYWRGALHWAVVPPLLPAQFQSKAVAVLVMLPGVPVLHRLALGAVSTVIALALPHTPLMGVGPGPGPGPGGDGAAVVVTATLPGEVCKLPLPSLATKYRV